MSYRWRDTIIIEPGLFVIHGFYKRYEDKRPCKCWMCVIKPRCGRYRLTLRVYWGFDGMYGISGFAFMRPFAFDLSKRMA